MAFIANEGIMCKLGLFIVIACLSGSGAFAQDQQPDTQVVVNESNALFPGGNDSMMRYFSLNLRYPIKAMEQKLEGEVMVGFEIDEQGVIHHALVISGLGAECDREAVRVVSAMPRWTPARRGGKPVKVMYRLPIYFQLPEKQEEHEP